MSQAVMNFITREKKKKVVGGWGDQNTPLLHSLGFNFSLFEKL